MKKADGDERTWSRHKAASTRQGEGAAPGTVDVMHPILRMQRTVGNAAVARLLESPESEGQADQAAAELGRGEGRPLPGESGALRPPPLEAGTLPSEVQSAVTRPGRPLGARERSRMESHFGVGLGDVRVHDDAVAAQSAKAIGAKAYTVGSHIAFGAGRHAPETAEGQRLLAHEVAHVVQQSAAGVAGVAREKDQSTVEDDRNEKMAQFGRRTNAEGKEVAFTCFATGVQIYESRPAEKGGGATWELVGPDAVLFDEKDRRIGTHYPTAHSEGKRDGGPTWESEKDHSKVIANLDEKKAAPTNDGSVAWLQLPVRSTSAGSGVFSGVTMVRRVETVGGSPPKVAPMATTRIRVPYKAVYYFFK